MKVFPVTFSFITLFVELHIVVILSIKQNLSHAWSLRPHTLNKLILQFILLSIKQILGHAWSLESCTLGKLILQFISLSIKQNLSHA